MLIYNIRRCHLLNNDTYVCNDRICMGHSGGDRYVIVHSRWIEVA